MNIYGVLVMIGLNGCRNNLIYIIIIFSLISQTALASDKCDCPTGATTAIKYYALGRSETFPGNGYVSISSVNNLSQMQHFNDANNSSSFNLTSQHPIMHPTIEQMSKWMGEYKAAPRAYLSPQARSMLSMLSGAHFSLLNYLQYTPSERDQGHCGNCWAWAGTGVMEIDQAYQTGIKDRLSVQYLDSNYLDSHKNCLACCGGWLDDVADFYSTTKKSIPWSNTNAQWQDGDTSCQDAATNVPANTISMDPHYNIASIDAVSIPTQGVGKETAIANIKNVLSQGKAVWFGFFLPDNNAWNNFFSFWDWQKESAVWQPDFACGKAYSSSQGGGHAVLCVGYDDTNPQNRYWIMLNSWGASSNRPNGLFLVNMDMNYDCSYTGLGYAFYWMTLNIKYANSPPGEPSIPTGPSSGHIGASYTYSTSAANSNGNQMRYTFDWGDGTNSTTSLVDPGINTSVSHAWSSTGTYKVRAMAIDSSGASSEWSSPLTVIISENAPPNQPDIPVGPVSGCKQVAYTYSTCAKDPDGNQVKYTFDWGDGTTSTTSLVNSGISASASHKWSSTGTYRIKAMATDSNDASSGWSCPLTVIISGNTPPGTPTRPSGLSSGIVGSIYNYSTLATNPNGIQVEYTFDWGDGTTSTTSLVNSGTSASASHAWTASGTYQVLASAMDSSGLSSGWSSPLTVIISENAPPNQPQIPVGSSTGHKQVAYTYVTNAKDPNGDQLKYTFDWGDGTSSITGLVNSGKSTRLSHKWSSAGIYMIKVMATDSRDASSGWSNSKSVRII